MFDTQDYGKLEIPLGLRDEGEHSWVYVTRMLHTPWYHVAVNIVQDDSEVFSRIMFLSQLEQLQQIPNDPSLKVTEIMLVSPGYLNGTDEWRMEKLKSVQVGIEPSGEYQNNAVIYHLENGNKYVESSFDTPASELLDLAEVFP